MERGRNRRRRTRLHSASPFAGRFQHRRRVALGCHSLRGCPTRASSSALRSVFSSRVCGQTLRAMPAAGGVTFDTGHADMIHDTQLDYYGRRLATCSSDRVVKVFDVAGDSRTHVADLTGHAGPVWQVSWAHPKFGHLLASCSFDTQVIVWKEVSDGVWHPAYTSPPGLHTASVNACAWAPHELGLLLASGSSDGSLSFVSCGVTGDGAWSTTKVERAHLLGCTSVSWAPPQPPGSLVAAGSGAHLVRRLVTGGCDNAVKVWGYVDGKGWGEEHVLKGHTDWVRDVAWAPNLGMARNTIASAGQDGKVLVWTQAEPHGQWSSTLLGDFHNCVWRVSWSAFGNVLAVADGSNKVTLWKEGPDGAWAQLADAPEPN